MKQEINNFIKNLQTLKMAENGLLLLQYFANHKKSDITDQVSQAYNITHAASENLTKIIYNCLDFEQKELEEQQIAITASEFAAKIAVATTIIKSITADQIPNKEELVEMLESCAAFFAEEKFAKIFHNIRANQSALNKEIISLQDLCQKE